jgi:hypothetical protein
MEALPKQENRCNFKLVIHSKYEESVVPTDVTLQLGRQFHF